MGDALAMAVWRARLPVAVELGDTLILLSSEGSGKAVFKPPCGYDVWLKGNRVKDRHSG